MKLLNILFVLFVLLIPFNLIAQATGIAGDSDINRCETKSYTISIQNTSGNPLTNIVVTGELGNLTGFTYINGSSSIDINGGGAFCTVNPTPSGPDIIWDIDASCPGSPFTLNNGDTLNISFSLSTDCSAVSGSLNTTINYDISGTPTSDTGVLNIQVNPGAVTIKKTQNVIPQVLGSNVTWTLTVENTGFGVIENVEITDVMGAGLAYVSSTQSGNNAGQTTTWTSAEYAALASMNPGDILTMDITATVIACDNLENVADVRFGCDPSPTNTCFDTSVDGGTARASVQRIVRTPDIAFTPPDISFTYCEDTENVSFTITNNGDGIAYDVWTIVDFSSFTVSNVSGGAVYNSANNRFELTNPLAASGGTYNLSFDLTYNTWCGGTFPSGDLLWQKLYRDECGQEFYPPVELSSINAPASSSSLAVSKTGGPSQIEIGGTITYTITSSYTGQLNCDSPSNPVGLITVVDTIPDGHLVTDAGGGVWAPGGGGTGGTITWTYTPPASLNTSITIQIPGVADCETYCNTTFTNNVEASGTDCCGCALNASASQLTAIECDEGVASDKTSSTPTERCNDTTYTNTYSFNSSVLLNAIEFTEEAELQQVYNGNLSILLDGNPVVGVNVTDTTPGGSVVLDFSGAAATDLNGSILVISYDLTATANTLAACSNNTFYSWSSLSMGTSGSSCLGDGIIHETTVVSLESPSMSLSISGLGQIYNTCETKTITMTFTQTSNRDPKDVQLVLSGLNYFVVNPGAVVCGGSVAPVSCNPVIDGSGNYVWTFNDGFAANNANATITIDVQKRCTGNGDLVATGYFDDACTDDATVDELCSVVASETPALLLTADLLIEKTPETYYATTNTVQWEVYITNRGTGTAYNVWMDDVLGSGLQYNHGSNPVTVDNMTGVTINDSLDHDGGAINGASVEILEMAAGERRQITFIAEQIDCNNLTNDVITNWGCIAVDCQTDVTDSSVVSIPAPNLINTNTITPAGGVDACESPTGFITLRNAGQITCYNLQVTETLPANLLYVSGTTRWRVNGGGWNGPNVIYDPNPTTSPLVWTSTEISGLASADSGDTIEIEFEMSADCPFNGGDITCSTQYENPCADVFNTSDSTFTATFNTPDITINKTRANDPIDCNQAIQWTITVTNNSGYTLPILWIEDTMDASYTYASSVGDPPFTSDNGTNTGQMVSWELRNINNGDTVTLTLNATTDSSPCSPDLDNTVEAWWGCGTADGSSATKPGVDAPDDSLCLGATGVTDVRTETREPTMGYLSIAMSPSSIDSCDVSSVLTVTLENTGPTDARNVDLVVTLPTGLSYNPGTSQSGLSTGQAAAIAALGGIGDPAITGGGTTLTWYDIGDRLSDIADTIDADGGNDTLVLRFSVQSLCYITANLNFRLYYYDCCDDTQYDTSSNSTLTALYPTLVITKTPTNSQVACGAHQSWTITVTNNGTGDAQVVRIEDTPGAWIDIDIPSSTAGLTDMGGGVYGWEFNNLAAGGGSQSFTIVGTLNPDGFPNQNDCTASLRQNNVQAVWACGTIGDAIDNNPTTTSNYDCTDSTPVTATVATLQLPNLVVTSITPVVSCTSDGNFSGTVTVRVTNNGNGATSGTFTVEVTDGLGWTGTGTYGSAIAAGGSANVTINTATWNPDCQPCGTPYSFNATVDLNSDICECNELDNTTGSATTYTPPIPDITIGDIAFTNISCTADGISGEVNVLVTNNGCGAATNFQVNLANDGCFSFDTSTFTIGNLDASSSVVLTFTINGNWTDCTTEDCVFTATADIPGTLCECDGTNNSRQETYSTVLPDLRVTNIDYSNVSCTNDAVSGFVRVTVQNQGFGSAANFNVRLATDGCLTFATDQAVVGPLTNGQTAIVDFPIVSSWANPADCTCDFTATVDIDDNVCECDGTNNTLTTTFNNPLPKLNVNSVTPLTTCVSDGSLTGIVTVNVSNSGCATANNVLVRLISDCGHTFTDQTVNLNAGANQNIVFNYTPSATACTCTFTASVDPDNTICESTNANHSLASAAYTPNIPDLLVQADSLGISCDSDGVVAVSGNLTVQNDGCGTNSTTDIPVRFTLYDNTGCTGSVLGTWTETLSSVNIASGGGTQAFTITSQNITADMVTNSNSCNTSIRVELDHSSSICEYDGTNNIYCADNKNVDIPNVEVSADTLGVSCTSDGEISVSGNVTLTNSGCGSNLTSNVPMRFTLYDNTGCSGNVLGTWTETFSSVNIAAGSGTQVFTINPNSIISNLVNNSTACQVSIRIEADYTGSGAEICESDGTDNTYCADKAIDIPDLGIQSDTITTDCSSAGEIYISGNVTIINNGCGSNMTSNVPVRYTLYDNINCTGNVIRQWSDTYSSMSIPANGGTQVVSITPRTLVFDLNTNSTNCQVSIRMEVDHTLTICESDGTNNELCTNKTANIPDLTINSVGTTVTCLSDGNLTGTTVSVSNTGCGAALGVVVRLSSDCGLTFTDQLIDLAAGATEDVFFPFEQKITGCSCNLTGTIDPDNLVCESDDGNNTMSSTAEMSIPDLEVSSDNTISGDNIRIECADDGKVRISGSIWVLNSGCGAAFAGSITTKFSLYSGRNGSGTKILEWTDHLNGGAINPGSTEKYRLTDQIFDLDILKNSDNGWLSIMIELDHNDSICEWNGDNNRYLLDKQTEFIDLIIDNVEYVCNPDNSVSFIVSVSNSGTQNVTGVYLEIINGDDTTHQLIDLPAGSTKTYDFKTKIYTEAIDTTFSFIIDRANDYCEVNGENNSKDINILCIPPGTPKLELTKTCPKADKPGGIFRFEIRIKNSGDGDARDVVIQDILPEKFKYVTGTTVINGVKADDPAGITSLEWVIGELKKGEELLLSYNTITDSDIKEGRYCNQAYSFGRTLDNKDLASEQASCCTIVTRNKEGCCLRIETEGKGSYKIPEMPVAFFKPYFSTEDAMYLSYSAFQFYKNSETAEEVNDDKVEFIRERLKNYAMSTIEEFYFNSDMGIMNKGKGLKYSFGGAYPITEDKGWKREGADKTMTLSQIAFEMLALNEAVLQKNEVSTENLKDILEGKVGFIQKLEIERKKDGKDYYPHSWKVGEDKLEQGNEKADLYDKTVLYFSVNTLIESGYNGLTEVSDWLGKDIKKRIKKDENKYRGREELFYILGLSKVGKTKLTRKRMKRFNRLVEEKKMVVDSLYVSALAMYSNLEFEGNKIDEFYSYINKKYYNSNIGIYSETLPDQTYKIDQKQLGSLILSMGRMKGEKQRKMASDIYRMIDETGLFLNKRHSSASFIPVNLIKNSSFMDQNVPIISTLKLNKNTAPVFSRDVRIYPSVSNRIEESVVFPNYSKIFSPSYEDDSARILAHSYSLQHIGGEIKANDKRIISERGRTLENIGQKYLEFMLDSKGGFFYENKLIVPFGKISVKGRVTDQLSIEPLTLTTDHSTESFANLFVAENIYIAHNGKKAKVLSETINIQKKIIEEFVKIGFVPEKFKLYIGSKIEENGSIKIIPSEGKADKITIVKLFSGFDIRISGKFIEKGTIKKLDSDDLIFLSHFPKFTSFFKKELEEVSATFARDITQKSASTIADRLLGKNKEKYLSDIKKFWEKDVELPVGRVERMSSTGDNRVIYDIQKYLLFLSALKKDDGFIFNRSLDYFSYLLEGEWGIVKNNRILTAPPKEIVLIKEKPRNYPEPGDIFTKQVRIYNRCFESYQGSRYFENLYIWTDFTTPLLYYGSEIKDDLTHMEGFKWKFKGMSEGGYLSFMYQALIPANYIGNNIKWHTFVSGFDRSDDINYGDKLDRCEDDHMGGGIFIRPLTEIKGIVYEDINVNGRRDAGELGITGIIIKDSLGRSLVTDENGEFRVKTGTEKLIVQIDMQSLPADLTMTTRPTVVVNNVFEHNISFGVVTCINVEGFVYDDINGNGTFNTDEPKVGGVFIKTRNKELITDKDGRFEIYNLPKSWKRELKIQRKQHFIDIKERDLKIFIRE